MLVLAHRGANRLEPENTVPAMAAAVALGADGVELDVHRTADGALVVRHDADTPVGRLGEIDLTAVRNALPDVPTLEEVLTVCEGRLVNVEVKDPDPRAAAALVALLSRRSDRVLVSSFDPDTIGRVHAMAPRVPTGSLSFGVPPESALAAAVAGGHAAVHPDLWTLVQSDVATFVARAHDLGVRVNVWTVNDSAEVEMLRDAGVDAVITDDASLYRYGRAGGAVTGR